MKTCIMGSGGLGGFFGGFLAAAGEDVTFIARGDHLHAMRKNGLLVESELGDRHIKEVCATDDPTQVGEVDIVLFCVKNYSLKEACNACRPLLKPDTAIISVLNGVDAAQRIEDIVGPNHAVSGITLVPSNIARPGVITHHGDKNDILFGETDGSTSSRLRAFRDACQNAGLNAQISNDIKSALWFKYVGWSSVSSVICANCSSFGDLQSDPALVELFRQAATEAFLVGRAHGADLPDDLVEKLVALVQSYPPQAKPSMLVDLQQGKSIEVDHACGKVVKLGAALGIATPTNRSLYTQLTHSTSC